MNEYMHTIAEVARWMETSPAGLKELRRQGIGPAHVVENGRVLYPDSALAEWHRACERVTA